MNVMKKKSILSLLFLASCFTSFAQYENKDEEKGGFKKENLFTGGTLNLAFGNQTTSLGISPYFGYSLNKFIDVAATLQYNYISERDYPFQGDKLRQTTYGPGAFVRIFPFNFLFAQAQYEFNMIRIKYIPFGTGSQREKYRLDAHSLLVGGGFSGGRDFPDQKSYYYISILWDVAKSNNSPYKDNLNRAVPIIRAGYNIALFQGRYNRDY
jgi:hypothetical protein